jgi:SAM-dependent methyltransferase
MTSTAEKFFQHGSYWRAWSNVPDRTADIGYAIAAVTPSDRCVLDVPCGRGRLLKAVRQVTPSAALVGADINTHMLRRVRGDVPGAFVYATSVYALPFRDHSFDAVLCHESFMHFDHPEAALAELCRVSRDRIYFSVTTRRQLNAMLRRLGLLGASNVPHWTYNIENIVGILPDAFEWNIVGAFLVGHKALRLPHRIHRYFHSIVGRHIPQVILRNFGQTLFLYGRRRI